MNFNPQIIMEEQEEIIWEHIQLINNDIATRSDNKLINN